MRIGQVSVCLSAGLVWALLASGATAAETESAAKDGGPKKGGMGGLLDVVGKLPAPSLSGLIKPDKMGLLTDNQCRIQDNESHLLSDNQSEVNLLSGNQTKILSGIRILSDWSVDVHITVYNGDSKAASVKPKNANHQSKSHQPRKQKSKKQAKDR